MGQSFDVEKETKIEILFWIGAIIIVILVAANSYNLGYRRGYHTAVLSAFIVREISEVTKRVNEKFIDEFWHGQQVEKDLDLDLDLGARFDGLNGFMKKQEDESA